MTTKMELFSHTERSARRKRIADQILKGDSVADVARQNNVTPHLVYASCKQFGVPIKREKEAWPVILKRLFDPKLAFTDISEQLNVTVQRISAIYKMAVDAGIPGLPVRKVGVDKKTG